MNVLKATNTTMVTANWVAMSTMAIAPFLIPMTDVVLVIGAVLMWQLFNILGISVGAHRYFSHRAFECNRFWQWTMAHLCMVSLVGPPCIWAEAHVRHHQRSDKQDDPYLRFALQGDSAINHTTDVSMKFLRRMTKSPLHKATLQYYWGFVLAHMVVIAVVGWLSGWGVLQALFWLYLVPAGASQLTLRFILWTGHVKGLGYRNFNSEDNTNNWWFASLIAAGEGWHNNHHAKPGAAKMGIKWWEFDPGWWVIRMIRQ